MAAAVKGLKWPDTVSRCENSNLVSAAAMTLVTRSHLFETGACNLLLQHWQICCDGQCGLPGTCCSRLGNVTLLLLLRSL